MSDFAGTTDVDAIRILVRCRPLLKKEIGDSHIVQPPIKLKPKSVEVPFHQESQEDSFTFDSVLGPDASQDLVFQRTGAQYTLSFFRECPASCVFILGHAGTGKSHTIFGDNSGNGILFLTCKQLLEDGNCRLSISYLGICGCTVYDGLEEYARTSKTQHPVLHVPALKQMDLKSVKDVTDLCSYFKTHKISDESMHLVITIKILSDDLGPPAYLFFIEVNPGDDARAMSHVVSDERREIVDATLNKSYEGLYQAIFGENMQQAEDFLAEFAPLMQDVLTVSQHLILLGCICPNVGELDKTIQTLQLLKLCRQKYDNSRNSSNSYQPGLELEKLTALENSAPKTKGVVTRKRYSKKKQKKIRIGGNQPGKGNLKSVAQCTQGALFTIAQLNDLTPQSTINKTMVIDAFPFSKGGYIELTQYRAITLFQLERIRDYARNRCTYWRDTALPGRSATSGQNLSMKILNLYHVNTWIILPATEDADCAMVELLTDKPQKPKWFASHWWGEPIADFCRCIEKHMKVRGCPLDTAYWVCAYANRQHSIYKELGQSLDLRESSFHKAMMIARGVLLVLNSETQQESVTIDKAIAFNRIWCAFYIFTALDKGLLLDIAAPSEVTEDAAELLTDGIAEQDKRYASEEGGWYQAKQVREKMFPLGIIGTGLKLHLEHAQASEELDRRRILNCIASAGATPFDYEPPATHEKYTLINYKVRARLAIATWQQAVDQKKDFAAALPDILAADADRDTLYLNFAFSAIESKDIREMAQALPTSLTQLRLYFRRCEKVDDDALDFLAAGIIRLQRLEMLELYLKNCENIQDRGLAILSSALPSSLHTLKMNFHGCRKITDPGISALVLSLSTLLNLKELWLDLSDIPVSTKGLGALSFTLPESVQKIAVHLRKTKVSYQDRKKFADIEELRGWLVDLDHCEKPFEAEGCWQNAAAKVAMEVKAIQSIRAMAVDGEISGRRSKVKRRKRKSKRTTQPSEDSEVTHDDASTDEKRKHAESEEEYTEAKTVEDVIAVDLTILPTAAACSSTGTWTPTTTLHSRQKETAEQTAKNGKRCGCLLM